MIQKIIPILILTLSFCSCQNRSSYQQTEPLPASGWKLGRVLSFEDSLSSEAPETLQFEVNLRHSNLYPYQNVWLYIQTRCSDGTTRVDSVDWKLSEPNGRWLGAGWGSLYTVSYKLPDLKIKKTVEKRWFSIKIQHGLRDENVQGIENIGIRLF